MAREPGERKVVAQNRRAFHDYAVEERIEAGLILSGTEVKSLREGRATIAEAHAGEMGGELWLFNAYIPEFHGGNRFNHEVRRPRKLMLRKREVVRLFSAIRRDGMTLIPLALYFTPRGWAKVELGVVKTMASINEPVEILGGMIGGALVGTFLGVYIAYGFVGPIAAKMNQTYEEDAQFYAIIRDCIVGYLQGHSAPIAVELARGNVPTTLQPSFHAMDKVLDTLPADPLAA